MSCEKSRKELLRDMTVIIADEVDERYAFLLEKCGALCVKLHEVCSRVATIQHLSDRGHSSICIFFDENRNIHAEVRFWFSTAFGCFDIVLDDAELFTI